MTDFNTSSALSHTQSVRVGTHNAVISLFFPLQSLFSYASTLGQVYYRMNGSESSSPTSIQLQQKSAILASLADGYVGSA